MLKIIIITICVGVLVLGGYFWIHRKGYLEAFLSHEFNATVSISEIFLNYRGIEMHEVTISNNLKLSQSTTINKIEIEFPIWSIFSNELNIKNLKIFNPKIYFELGSEDGRENSLTTFLTNLPHNRLKRFTIKNLYLYNIEFQAYDSIGSAFEIWPIGYLDITDLAPHLTLTELTEVIINKIEPRMVTTHPLPFHHITP